MKRIRSYNLILWTVIILYSAKKEGRNEQNTGWKREGEWENFNDYACNECYILLLAEDQNNLTLNLIGYQLISTLYLFN